ncbi:peptidoglycan-binding protein [Paraburkholderia sediminicola]|uniref:peptidoglycan-binding protein n=1 Tax=Paraburkholderia sediminicola TaxID=458836 RepID=UPI0038BAA330
MAELPITAAVGAPPSPNKPADVRTVQLLLKKVQPPLASSFSVTSSIDPQTMNAIREFQRRFMNHPDGKVDPDGRTLMHLNDGFATTYIGCDPHTRVILDRDVIEAQKWLDTVNRRLANTADADMRRKVFNIFHVDVTLLNDVGRLAQLRIKCLRLRRSLDEKLTFKCENKANAYAAWVKTNDPTIHVPLNYLRNTRDTRIVKIIHERSHSVLNTNHSGMPPDGEIIFGDAPDDLNKFSFEQAIQNAYCYEWLAAALQPTYSAEKARQF